MAMRVQGPNGAIVEFPDGTDNATIGKAMMQLSGGATPAQEEAKPSWWQENITGVADPKYGNLPSVYSQFPDELHNVTGLAATLGASDPQMGDIVAKSLGSKVVRREKDAHGYDVFVTKGKDGQAQKAYLNRPGLDLEDVSRGIHQTLPYMVGGGVGGAVGRGLLGRAALDGLIGAGTSIAGDVAQQPLGSEQGIEGEKALMIGGLSGVAPLAGRAISNGVGYIRDKLAPVAPALQAYSPKAVSRIEEAMQGSGGHPNLDRQGYQDGVNALGHESAMLGDMTQTLQDDTAMLAGVPGASDVAGANLRQRQNFAPDRLRSSINVNVGPEINLPQHLEQQDAHYNALARPHYQAFEMTDVPLTDELQNYLRAAEAHGATRKAEQWLAQESHPSPATRVPGTVTGQYLQYVKEALDDVAGNMQGRNTANAMRRVTNANNGLRRVTDAMLNPAQPAQGSWARGRAIAGEGLEGNAAARQGAQAFGPTPRDPHLVADDLQGMSQYGQDSYRAGGRNRLRQVMGRAASNYNAKGDSAVRRALNSEFSRENMDQILGQPNSANLARRVNAENRMAETYDLAFGNSKTARMLAAKERWPVPGDSKFASEAGKKGPVGLATEAVFRAGDALVGSPMRRSAQRALTDGARIMTATGPERDALVHALFDHIDTRAVGRQNAVRYDPLVREMLRSSRGLVPQNAD